MAQVITEGLSVENPLFRVYAFYCSILVLKMMGMSVLTAMTRFKTKMKQSYNQMDVVKYTEGLENSSPNVILYKTLALGVAPVCLGGVISWESHTELVEAFVNPEDTFLHKVKVRQDENVERVRRAHLNDLENIPIFFVVSLIYILTNPSYTLAALLFRGYTLARIVHSIVYAVVVIPQPARALSWGAGFAITGYMAFQNILHFLG